MYSIVSEYRQTVLLELSDLERTGISHLRRLQLEDVRVSFVLSVVPRADVAVQMEGGVVLYRVRALARYLADRELLVPASVDQEHQD